MLGADVLDTMLYGCVTWSPHACHHKTLRRAYHSFLTPCICWRKNNRNNHPISYMDTLKKTGSESVEANIRSSRWIMFAGFVARMEDTRLPKCMMFIELMEDMGCVGGQEKEWTGCFRDNLGAFDINADQSTTAAQDEVEWRKKVKQGAERFMAKCID